MPLKQDSPQKALMQQKRASYEMPLNQKLIIIGRKMMELEKHIATLEERGIPLFYYFDFSFDDPLFHLWFLLFILIRWVC